MTQAVNLANFANNLDSSGGVNPSALNSVVPIAKGGTNSSTASAARTALDVPSTSGSGATGTWAIGISGNAASSTTVADGAITEIKLAPGVAAANLGFNPIQQGGGTGQLANKVYIGWSGSQLKAQVDATDMGGFVMQSAFTDHSLSGNGYQKLPGGLIMQWGSYNNPASTTTITLPIAFPNAFLNVQVSLYDASVSAVGGSIQNTSQFNFTRDAAYGVSGFYWFAIGY